MKQILKTLPLEGKESNPKLGWSETNWPSMFGGVAIRWNRPSYSIFWYKDSPSLKELKKMTAEQKAMLSPTELYDISQGNYKYPLTKKVLKMNYPDAAWWAGICDGWSLASLNYPEPQPIKITNSDGIEVEFGSSDLKGLLSLHEAYNNDSVYASSGERCDAEGKVPGEENLNWEEEMYMPDYQQAESWKCADVNAGAFHLIITNMLGLHGRGFVADIDRFSQVWNHPVTGYKVTEITVLNATSVKINLDMYYADLLNYSDKKNAYLNEKSVVSKFPVLGTSNQINSTRSYEYILEMDSEGRIVGGEWTSLTRPDFVWMKGKNSKFKNSKLPLAGLGSLIK